MWTRTYLFLVGLRLYFALSPSYIHPDENFQGPEVIAGRIFGFNHLETWEFTSAQPIRSVFPLWLIYGLPMMVLHWLWTETGGEEVAPEVIYYMLRGVMFILSFVLEDWAIHELVHSPRQRRLAVILIASSYATWTYQTHTFSNSIETLVVLWSLVLIQRIRKTKQRSSAGASALLGFLVTFGSFNRITFPAFLLLPGLYLLPQFIRKPLSLLTILLTIGVTSLVAHLTDTFFYYPTVPLCLDTMRLTPVSALLYNLSPANLSIHGTHPFYQHFLVNLPILALPALPLLLSKPNPSIRLFSALSATVILSFFSHQEARFLLPCIPLILSSISLPASKRHRRVFIGAWILFNAFAGVLMGIYHQGGVIPMQIHLGRQTDLFGVREVLWWKTYSPPVWLLDGKSGVNNSSLQTIDLMGMPVGQLMALVQAKCGSRDIIVVAPRSRTDLDPWTGGSKDGFEWKEVWTEWRHLNLDDLDWGEEGLVRTLKKIVSGRGLTAWIVRRG